MRELEAEDQNVISLHAMVHVESIGDKVEQFYLSLATLASPEADAPDLYRVAECLQAVEEHQPLGPLGETFAIVDEIAQDCRKKAAQCIRNTYTKLVQSMIVSCRKRLISKINRNATDEDAKNHGSRHYNLLKELLGKWSNIITEISELGLSLQTLHACISTLHQRIIECSLDCMTQFQKDKSLDTWHQRVLSAESAETEQHLEQDGKDVTLQLRTLPFSLLSLDNLVSQVAAMRELVGTYYAFLDSFSSPELKTRIYDDAELNQWRELDVMYMSLEGGYLTHSVAAASREAGLVEVQTGVLVPQAIEDTFFIVTRVAERCMSTLAYQPLMTVANKILELVDADAAESALQLDAGNKHLWYRLPRLLAEQRVFRGCYAKRSIYLPALEMQEGHGDTSLPDPPHGGTGTPSPRGEARAVQPVSTDHVRDQAQQQEQQHQEQLTAKVESVVGEELAEELALGINVISDVGGAVVGMAKGWFSARHNNGDGPSSEDGPKDQPLSVASTLANTSDRGTGPSSFAREQKHEVDQRTGEVDVLNLAMSGLGLASQALPDQDLFLGCYNSYEARLRGYDQQYGDTGNNNPNPYCLTTADWSVLLNSLYAARQAIANISMYFGEMVPQSANALSQGSNQQLVSTVQLVVGELNRAEKVYAAWFDDHVEGLLLEPFLLYLAAPLADEIFSNPEYYVIGADEMDRRNNGLAATRSNRLVHIVQAFVHKPTREEEIGPEVVENVGDARGVRMNGGSGANSKQGSKLDLTQEGGGSSGGGDGDNASEATERDRLRRLEKEAQKVSVYSILERCVQPYCSSATYSALLHKLAEFTCEQLLLEVLGEDVGVKESPVGIVHSSGDIGSVGEVRREGGARFSEWGALLFYQEVMAIVEVFELADEKVHSQQQGQGQAQASQRVGGTDGGIRSKFYPLLWAVKLLTLDKPGDVSRYRIPATTFAGLEGAENEKETEKGCESLEGEGDSGQNVEESYHRHRSRRRSSASPAARTEADITRDLACQVLARRVDFNLATISKLKLNIV